MSNYPIEGLMNSAMNSIREMIDVNTIIGDPIETSSNVVIIPVSKVNFGFAAGGSEFKVKGINDKKEKEEEKEDVKLPFGGGSGARSKHKSYCLYCSTTIWSKAYACNT